MIELSRSLTFGQYVNNGSALNRMDPRAKLVCAVLYIALFSFISRFSAFLLCFLCCIAIFWLSRLPLLYVLRSFKPLIFVTIVLYIFTVLFYASPTQHTTLLWQWGIFSISGEGMLRGVAMVIRLFLLYYLTSVLTFSTSLVDLTNGSEALLLPLEKIGIPVSSFIMVFVIAFKFVPIFVGEVERLTKAQAARGVRFDQGNFIQRTRKLAPLLLPLFLSGFRRAEVLAIAMEARCYRPGRRGQQRSKRRELHFERSDAVALIFTVTTCIIAFIVNFVAPF